MSAPKGTGISLFDPPPSPPPGAHLPLRPLPALLTDTEIAVRNTASGITNYPLQPAQTDNEGDAPLGDHPHQSADDDSAVEEEEEEEEANTLPTFPRKFHSSIDYALELPFNLTLKNNNSLTNSTKYLAWLIRQ